MNHSSLRTSRPPRGVQLAELTFDEDEDTTPSTPYVPRACAMMARARASESPLLRMMARWYDAVARWFRGR